MTKHTAIDLDDDLSAFVEAEVSVGNYASSSEVVAAALRLLEKKKLGRLQELLDEGEESGFPEEDFDFDAFIAEMHKSV